MTPVQRLTLEQSEVRQKINGLLGKDEFTDTERAELGKLTTRAQQVETEYRAAVVAASVDGDGAPEEITTETPEDRELRSLLGDASLGLIFEAVLEHRQIDGREAELQQAYGLAPNQFPLELLAVDDLETRAVTPDPADVGQNQAAIIPCVFPRSVGAFLGVDMPTVGVGEAVYPVLTTNATAHTPAEGASAAETTGSFSADVLSPSRLQASFFYSREDRARFAGMDRALRANLNSALADKLDQQIIAGPNGLLGSASVLDAIVNASAEADFAAYRGLIYDPAVLDGLYAYQASDVRLVVGRHTYNHAAGKYRANNADDSAIDSLLRVSGGVRISRHVPDPATSGGEKDDQAVIISKAPTMPNAVAPIWQGVTLIPDEITKASTGEIVVTAVMLHAVKVLRKGGFVRKEVQIGS